MRLLAFFAQLCAALLALSAAFTVGDAHEHRASAAKHNSRLSNKSAECSSYVIVTTRGTSEPQGPSFAFARLVQETLAAVPGGVTHDTVYPAQYTGTSPIAGMAALQAFLEETVRRCPEQKIVLLGYSQGSYVTSLALQSYADAAHPVFKAVHAIVMFGNPVHDPHFGAAANVDENGGPSTLTAQGAIFSPFTPTVPGSYLEKTKDVCILGDFVCDELNPTKRNVHGSYGASDSAQRLGAAFLQKRLQSAA